VSETFKQPEVIYKFYADDNHSDIQLVQNVRKYFSALWEISSHCRYVINKKEDATEQEEKLAEEIFKIFEREGVDLDVEF